ncbi:SCO family protein [Alterisphingorhabdus coralli]|uniref:SCO family protein n=1 Tax=Alterisphingorhabdus coralli TaxID=3071408 RepID=A0AA97I216_9SPHN|nr:SCO family protein [Parasphingorhabdus sp. SCSIO 66989]WOE75828.1 SCO family protein [Parasphingorhabdus sp. SCSIO 66989]
MNAEAPLAGADIGGSFTLTNQDGETVSDSDFAGQYRIMYFGYTYCPDVCPVDLQKMVKGFAEFEKAHPERAAKIQPIFVTIDPARDTPEVLKSYVNAFHPRLIGLTGSETDIDAVREKFAVHAEKVEDESATEYLVDHSRQAYLLDAAGKPLALLSVDKTPDGQASVPSDIAAEIDRWGPAAS